MQMFLLNFSCSIKKNSKYDFPSRFLVRCKNKNVSPSQFIFSGSWKCDDRMKLRLKYIKLYYGYRCVVVCCKKKIMTQFAEQFSKTNKHTHYIRPSQSVLICKKNCKYNCILQRVQISHNHHVLMIFSVFIYVCNDMIHDPFDLYCL